MRRRARIELASGTSRQEYRPHINALQSASQRTTIRSAFLAIGLSYGATLQLGNPLAAQLTSLLSSASLPRLRSGCGLSLQSAVPLALSDPHRS